MKLSSISFVIFSLAFAGTEGKRTLRTRQLNQKKQPVSKRVWKKEPVHKNGSPEGDNHQHRRLLNGGAAFIVSQATRKETGNVDWCMDAIYGAAKINYYGNGEEFPTLGFRPCAYNAGPAEQLFLPGGAQQISSRFDWDTCLIVGNGKDKPKDGQVVRLGPCTLAQSKFIFEDEINKVGLIKVASNTSLCLTNSGTTQEDYDDIIVKECKPKSDRFKFMMRSGYYSLYGGDGCVSVATTTGIVESGNPIVLENCEDAGFAAHWRLDGDGLFHSRLDEGYCMDASEAVEGSVFSSAPCDKTKDTQRFSWPDGFEAPISLLSKPNLYLDVQGQNDALGDPVTLKSNGREWSGDSVHV